MSMDSHSEIMLVLGRLERETQGINHRLDGLNGSVAKHADKLAAGDVINAQITLTQQQILKDVLTLKEQEKEKSNGWKAMGEKLLFSVVIPAIGFVILLTLTRTGILNLA